MDPKRSSISTSSKHQVKVKSRERIPLLPAVYDLNEPKYSSIGSFRKVSKESQDNIIEEINNKIKLPDGQSSITGVLFNLLNALVGAGILSIPYSYSKCGIFGGILLMFIFAILCTYTLNLVIFAAQKMNVLNFEDLGYKCYGIYGYLAVCLSMFLLDYGVLITCLIIMGDSLSKVISIWGYNTYSDRQIIILIVSFVIIYPLCLKRDVSHIEIYSFIKAMSLLLVTCVIIYEYINMSHITSSVSTQMTDNNIIWFNISGFPFALGIFAFAFVCHDTSFLYYNSLYNPTTIRWTQLSFGGISSAMIISIILSIPCYLTFTNDISGNLLNNYPINSVLIIIVRILYVLCMALTYPLPLFIVRHISYSAFIKYKKYNSDKNQNNKGLMVRNGNNNLNEHYTVKTAPIMHHVLFSSTVFGTTLLISMFVDNLGKTMSIIGSLTSVNLAFVFPCLFYIKSSEYTFKLWKYNTSKEIIKAFITLYPPAILTVCGAFIATFSVVNTIME